MRTSTETYEHTINGLRQKRAELMQEIAVLSERLGVLTNDVDAINHVLARLGDTQKFDVTTRVPRIVLFYRGQLQQFLLHSIARARARHDARSMRTARTAREQGQTRPAYDG